MKKYELYMREKYVCPEDIKNGCTKLEECELQDEFNNLEEATIALGKCSSSANDNYKQNDKILVTEYFIDEITLDDDNEAIDSKTIAYADGLGEKNEI